MKLRSASTALAVVQLLTLSLRAFSAPVLEEPHTGDHPTDVLFVTPETYQLPIGETVDSDATPLPARFENTDDDASSIPSRYDSTLLARRLLHLSSHGDLVTVFPSPENLTSRTPSAVATTPIGLPEYIATCEGEGSPHAGDPTILSLKISTATRNANAGSNVSLAVSWWDEYVHLTGTRPWALANLPRLSLTGYLEEIPRDAVISQGVETCFLAKHRDSIMWLPGRKWAAHEGFWTRLVVQQAYWIGGFGDKNYIGWLDPEEWRGVQKHEWEGVRLPGEKA